MMTFIAKECESLSGAEMLIDFEEARYVTWDEPGERVFISTALSCPGGCSFCYIPSLINESSGPTINNFGIVLGKTILHDPRFRSGRLGTAVMLGGFSDPLLGDNIERTLQFLSVLGATGNIIHLATRFTFGSSLARAPIQHRNIIINYSLSTLRQGLELKNQERRFTEAKSLIASGVTVALYVRPVLPDVTLRDVPRMIELCQEVGIHYITVGGLYIDQRIKGRLTGQGIKMRDSRYTEKKFVLDKNPAVLRKLQNDEVDRVAEQFMGAGFEVFLSSQRLIESLRGKSPNQQA